MNNNFLYPEALADVVEGLVDRTGAELPEHLRASLTRKLIHHFRTSAEDIAPARRIAATAPEWARSKRVVHPLPSVEFAGSVRVVACALARAQRLVTSGVLKARESELHSVAEAALKGLAHEAWSDTVNRCARLGNALERWETAQIAAFPPLRADGLDGRMWRRLCSVQEVWDASHGTKWCTRKRSPFDVGGLHLLSEGALEFWVLERSGVVLALMSYDREGRAVREAKDVRGHTAFQFRNDIQQLMAAAHIVVGPSYHFGDGAGLALDPHIGLPGQPFKTGSISPGQKGQPLAFRLWADGRRGRYLAAFLTEGSSTPEFYLRVDTKVRDTIDDHYPMVVGMWPYPRRAAPRAVMRHVLKAAYPAGARPLHVCQALRRLANVQRDLE